MINILHLLWIVPVAASAGFIFFALLSDNKEREEMLSHLVKLERENAKENLRCWGRQIKISEKLRAKLSEAEKDMATLIDCCDICGHNNNPNCPGDDCETCGVECQCRDCRNSSKFIWRGNDETEGRSGIYDTGNGETEKGGGYRQGSPESIYSAQAGNGVREREA